MAQERYDRFQRMERSDFILIWFRRCITVIERCRRVIEHGEGRLVSARVVCCSIGKRLLESSVIGEE